MTKLQSIIKKNEKKPEKLLGIRLDYEKLNKLNNIKKRYKITLKKLVTGIIDDFLKSNKMR